MAMNKAAQRMNKSAVPPCVSLWERCQVVVAAR